MVTYKTPGVYVEEISTFPPSVAEVATAIPAFLGYTESGPQVARINTLLEYETLFGGPPATRFTITTRTDSATGVDAVATVQRTTTAQHAFLLYYSLSLYFKNGGGSCYIVSVGSYNDTPAKADFEVGLAALEKEDEPTLIVLTDAVNLGHTDYYDLCQQALAQCNKLGDRFAILDLVEGDDPVQAFRDNIGTNNLKYGAAYYPALRTTLNYRYAEEDVVINDPESTGNPTWQYVSGDDGIVVNYTGSSGDAPRVRIVQGDDQNAVDFAIDGQTLTIRNVAGRSGADIVSAWQNWQASNDPAGFDILPNGNGTGTVPHTSSSNVDLTLQTASSTTKALSAISATNTALYNQIKAAMVQQRVILPPSAAMAGIYAQVDRERGVWKAPANVSVSSVIGPVVKITNDEQENLNVDPTAGKSINALRAFTGKGTLVWGARTLAGNDNEWRYVPVRRLFNLIEESTQKATAFAVFEPNDATTWLKVKAMIESYLYGLWEEGALAGPTPDAAYFVNVGLGKTMTPQDVLEGRMIVEIGIAAVRPAEFIILRFTHKMQEA